MFVDAHSFNNADRFLQLAYITWAHGQGNIQHNNITKCLKNARFLVCPSAGSSC